MCCAFSSGSVLSTEGDAVLNDQENPLSDVPTCLLTARAEAVYCVATLRFWLGVNANVDVLIHVPVPATAGWSVNGCGRSLLRLDRDKRHNRVIELDDEAYLVLGYRVSSDLSTGEVVTTLSGSLRDPLGERAARGRGRRCACLEDRQTECRSGLTWLYPAGRHRGRERVLPREDPCGRNAAARDEQDER